MLLPLALFSINASEMYFNTHNYFQMKFPFQKQNFLLTAREM